MVIAQTFESTSRPRGVNCANVCNFPVANPGYRYLELCISTPLFMEHFIHRSLLRLAMIALWFRDRNIASFRPGSILPLSIRLRSEPSATDTPYRDPRRRSGSPDRHRQVDAINVESNGAKFPRRARPLRDGPRSPPTPTGILIHVSRALVTWITAAGGSPPAISLSCPSTGPADTASSFSHDRVQPSLAIRRRPAELSYPLLVHGNHPRRPCPIHIPAFFAITYPVVRRIGYNRPVRYPADRDLSRDLVRSQLQQTFSYPTIGRNCPSGLYHCRRRSHPGPDRIFRHLSRRRRGQPGEGNAGGRFRRGRPPDKQAWNQVLGRIEIKGGDEAHRRTFYTALYHSCFMPAVISDAGEFAPPLSTPLPLGYLSQRTPPDHLAGPRSGRRDDCLRPHGIRPDRVASDR